MLLDFVFWHARKFNFPPLYNLSFLSTVGHGNEAGCSTPKRVEGLAGLVVAQIACGSRHTAVVTSQGALYSWGDKENGVAGHGEVEGHQYTPRLVERLAGKRIVQLSACGFHTGCLTDNLELYTWGGAYSNNSPSRGTELNDCIIILRNQLTDPLIKLQNLQRESLVALAIRRKAIASHLDSSKPWLERDRAKSVAVVSIQLL